MKHPLDTLGGKHDDGIHPEVKEDINQHIEEEDKKEKIEKKLVEEADEKLKEYEIPMDYAYEGEKDSTDYVLGQVNEKLKTTYPTEKDIPRVEEIYEPGEALDGHYEKLRVKILERGKILPGGWRKHLSPMRKKLMDMFAIGRYRGKN
ncbi:MAG: hypothetical protein V3V78_01895 [Candidatus Woesearchaeota archaeon]